MTFADSKLSPIENLKNNSEILKNYIQNFDKKVSNIGYEYLNFESLDYIPRSYVTRFDNIIVKHFTYEKGEKHFKNEKEAYEKLINRNYLPDVYLISDGIIIMKYYESDNIKSLIHNEKIGDKNKLISETSDFFNDINKFKIYDGDFFKSEHYVWDYDNEHMIRIDYGSFEFNTKSVVNSLELDISKDEDILKFYEKQN